jgi:hypothetical protein
MFIDPYRITNFRRTDAELEGLFCFCVAVAGKKAVVIAAAINRFFEECGYAGTPFDLIRAMSRYGSLRTHLVRSRVGKYDLLEKAYVEAATANDLDLRSVSPERLEAIHGVGAKTARFFILHRFLAWRPRPSGRGGNAISPEG